MIQYLYAIGALHLMICPFTKVEESFNIQAMHDIIYHKWNFTEFDHNEFPGVVPRTFLGPIVITLLLSPLLTVVDFLGLIATNKFICQYLVRAALGCCVLYSFHRLYKAVKDSFGEGVALWFFALTASQYHFMFYLSRPLPNILALPLVLLALTSWLKQDHMGLICFSAAAVVIFRFELAFFLGLMILIEIIRRNISFFSALKIGIGASILALVITVAVDSIFWNRLVWPEGEVFWFNVILNKSSNWGVSPFFWYWYSALPRALGTSITLVPFGDQRTKVLLIPALLFVSLMSFLPHKELRFIIYTFPIFNISAASFCNRVWINRHKSMGRWICSIYLILHLLANVFLTCILIKVASNNYPGGQAMTRLHQMVPSNSNAHIYIDNLAAQTGVSKFTQINNHWIYNKTENLQSGSDDYFRFTHLLLEAKSKYSPNLKPFLNSHEILDIIEGFSHIHFNYNSFPPFKIKSKPMIFILKRNYALEEEVEIDEQITASIPDSIEENINDTMITQISPDDVNLIAQVSPEFVNSIETKNELSNENIISNLTRMENEPAELPKISSNFDELNEDHKITSKIYESNEMHKIKSKIDESDKVLKIRSSMDESDEEPKILSIIDESINTPKTKLMLDEPFETLKTTSKTDDLEVPSIRSMIGEPDEFPKIRSKIDVQGKIGKIKSRTDEPKNAEFPKIRPKIDEQVKAPKIKSRVDDSNVDESDDFVIVRPKIDDQDKIPKVKSKVDVPEEEPNIRSIIDEVSKIKSRVDNLDEIPRIRLKLDETVEDSKIRPRLGDPDEISKPRSRIDESHEILQSRIDEPDTISLITSKLDESDEVPKTSRSRIDKLDEAPKSRPRIDEPDEISKVKSRINVPDEVSKIRLKVENAPKLSKAPLKMNVDDFFEDINEKPVKTNTKKFSVNKTVKIPSLKDKTVKIKASPDLEK